MGAVLDRAVIGLSGPRLYLAVREIHKKLGIVLSGFGLENALKKGSTGWPHPQLTYYEVVFSELNTTISISGPILLFSSSFASVLQLFRSYMASCCGYSQHWSSSSNHINHETLA